MIPIGGMSDTNTPDSPVLQVEFNNARVGMSHTVGKLAAAMAKAQGQIKTAAMNAVNPHFKKDYADLADVRDACRDALAANDLCVIQLPFGEENKVVLRSVLMHGSGEFMWSDLPASANWSTPQAIGSAITYLRRYALSSITGVAPKGEDDDGEAAEGRAANGRPSTGQRPAPDTGKSSNNGGGNQSSGPPPIPDVVKPYAKRFEDLTDADGFHKLLASCRDTFAEGTDERRAFNYVVSSAAKRLGIQPKRTS